MENSLYINPKTADEAKRQLVLGNRILAAEGILDCFGHLSVRNPENPETFFQSRSLAAEFVTEDDILELDFQGNVVSGKEGMKPYWENVLHGRIMAVRPDVNSIIHAHPAIMIVFADMPEIPVLPVTNCGGVFYNGYGYYSSENGSDMTVCTVEEADKVAAAMGEKWAVLMRGHGITAAAGNIPEMVADMVSMVKNAGIYSECLKIGGKITGCTAEEGLAYRKSHHKEKPLSRTWDYYVRRMKNMGE